MTDRYDDIIMMEHHSSATHPRMSRSARAAQFAAFAALNGHSAAIAETARLTQERRELSDYECSQLDVAMAEIRERLDRDKDSLPLVRIVHFVPDGRKSGGSYQEVSDRVVKIDDYNATMISSGGRCISIRDICELSIMD